MRRAAAVSSYARALMLAAVASSLGIAASPGYSEKWLLVRFHVPLRTTASDGSFAIVAGLPRVDATISEAGIYHIEPALPVSSRLHAEQLAPYGLDRTYRLFVPGRADIPALVKAFSALPEVELAEPDYVISPGGVVLPNDPQFPAQWALDQASDADLDAPEAWTISHGGNQVIAFIDSGVDASHEDLQGKIVAGYDFRNDDPDPDDEYGHGTPISSIAVAATNNGVGMAGTCWGCSEMPLKIWDSANLGEGTSSDAADAIVWGTSAGARIMNLSGGFAVETATLHSAVMLAYDAGVVLVSITHNGNQLGVLWPAKYPEVIAVGGTDMMDRRAVNICGGLVAGSNYGPEIAVVAPAELVTAARRGGGYGLACGTSVSAPFVSGLIGIIRSMYPSVGRDEARFLVEAGADDQVGRPEEDTPGFDIYHGWGRINMERSVLATRSTTSLRADGALSTRVRYEVGNPLAASFDFIRGDLQALSESTAGVALGATVCLKNDSPTADTTGADDTAIPSPGHAFFYLARFNGTPGPGSYGGSSRNRDRRPTSGGCPD